MSALNGWRDRRATVDELHRVGEERDRQERLVLTGKFSRTCASPDSPDDERLAVLGEEVGEVAKAFLEHGPRSRELRDELIQVAAVAVAWAEALTCARVAGASSGGCVGGAAEDADA